MRWKSFLIGTVLAACAANSAWCWDYTYHRLVNEWALRSLPPEFPSFVRDAAHAERIAFLAGEPDRWRNTPESSLKHANEPEHFFDLEDLGPLGLAPQGLHSLRHDYIAQVALAGKRQASGGQGASDPGPLRLPGLLPWRISEDYARLKSAFSYMKTYETRGGSTDEIANARENAVYLMGIMGHYIGDAAQPLHATRCYNGWVGPNPLGYTTNRAFHAWIDGKFLETVHFAPKEFESRLRPARIPWSDSGASQTNRPFAFALEYVVSQNPKAETLYRLEKEGKLGRDPVSSREGQEFLGAQLMLAAQTLGDLWYAAFRESTEDVFLRSQLAQRQLKSDGAGGR